MLEKHQLGKLTANGSYNKDMTINLHVNGLIASGDNKLAIDWTPAINPCAFPCNNN